VVCFCQTHDCDYDFLFLGVLTFVNALPPLQVTELLRRYLGAYVEGLDKEKLRISVWSGDVVLHNLKLRPGALDTLNLPVKVTAGLLGTLRLKVPWTNLGKEPVVVEIDRVFCLARRTRPEGEGEAESAAAGGGRTEGGAEGGIPDAAPREGSGEAGDAGAEAVSSEEAEQKRQRVEDAERAWLLLREAATGKGAACTGTLCSGWRGVH
jgi:hypothetical protein